MRSQGARQAAILTALALILTGALAFRLYGIFWDAGNLFHPDERWMLTVADQLHWPTGGDRHSLDPFWDPENGHNREFAYGHVPLYAVRVVQATLDPWLPLSAPWPAPLTRWMGGTPADELERLAVTGRGLGALLSTATVAMLFALGRRLYDAKTALLAAGFLAVAVLPIQLAHFYTVDPWATFFGTVALWAAIRLGNRNRRRDATLAGAATGLATGCKLSMILLFVPLLTALANGAQKNSKEVEQGSTHSPSSTLHSPSPTLHSPFSILHLLLPSAAMFVLTNPFALLDAPTFAESMAVQFGVVHGWLDYPYIRQYHGTLPFVYPIVQQWRWGLGPLLGATAWIGLAWLAWRAWQRRATTGEIVVLAWVLPYLLIAGGGQAKFVRYLLPITPFLCLLAARWLTSLPRPRLVGRATLPLGNVLAGFVLAGSLIYALAFANIYRQPHTWIRASAWIYEHVPPGSVLAVEHWDQALPVNLIAGTQVLDHDRYRQITLQLFDLEDEGRFDELYAALADSDYVVIASRRLYGALTRWPERYPRTTRYYRLLFGERLGFRLVHADRTQPHLGPLTWREDPVAQAGLPVPALWQHGEQAGWIVHPGPADESFAVYDHPTPLIFARAEKLSARELRRRIESK